MQQNTAMTANPYACSPASLTGNKQALTNNPYPPPPLPMANAYGQPIPAPIGSPQGYGQNPYGNAPVICDM